MSGSAGLATELEPGYVRQRATVLVKDTRGRRVLLLHARPEWSAQPTMVVDGRTVRIRPCVSQLAALDEIDQLPDDEFLIILTDRDRKDLGDAVVLRARGNEIELPDLWTAVPGLFRANDCSRDLRKVGNWASTALLAFAPSTGWPPSPGPEVSAEFALGNLIAHVLGLSLPESPDAELLFSTLGEPGPRTRWADLEPTLRGHLVEWAAKQGAEIGFILRVAETRSPISPLAIGLALDTLVRSNPAANDAERGLAIGRLIERHLGGKTPSDADRLASALAARASISRRLLTDPDSAMSTLAQAEALVADLGWAAGPATSDLLPAGLNARLRDLGASLKDGAQAAEQALVPVQGHALARSDAAQITTARMAVRLARWLETDEIESETFSASLQRQVDDGAWVDRAVTTVWNGSDDPELANHYADLIARVQARRSERDRIAADQLARHTTTPEILDSAVPIEGLLAKVVRPWSLDDGVLLIVLDGMSVAVATEIAESAPEIGLAEWVPSSGSRMCAVTALPSLTELSRTSLFAGSLTRGHGAEEKRGLSAAFPGAPLFHKDDLRSEAGAQLPPAVREAIDDPTTHPVVGVVINTIDDTLHKQDVAPMRWTLDRLAPLRALLAAARFANRRVVLTADHGHVVERSSDGRSVPGASSRWRDPGTGPVGDGEVLVSGSRVLTESNQAVLLWREDVHYGSRHPGYHGGAALAEITIPVIVLQREFTAAGTQPGGPEGWQPAAPQTPEWWNEPARAAEVIALEEPAARSPRGTTKAKSVLNDPSQDALFDVVAEPDPSDVPAPSSDLVVALLASSVYATQKSRAGRHSVSDETLANVLRALLTRSNRAHRDTLAVAAGIPAHGVEQMLAAVKRLLNVDGYSVIELDVDLATIKLDETALRDQFEL